MADTLQGGVAPVAHSFFGPGEAEVGANVSPLRRYDYDPRRSVELIESLGYARGADGAFRDRAGERLELETRTGPQDQAFSPGTAITDYWKRIGIEATAVRSSPSLQPNAEAVATFPGFYIANGPYGEAGLRALHSSQAPTPQNGFQLGAPANRSRYMNPEMDRLIEGYFRAIAIPDRVALVSGIAQHVADRLPVMGIYYNPEPAAYGNRLLNLKPSQVSGSPVSWNAHEWDIRA